MNEVGALNIPGEHLLDHSVANAVAVKCDAQMVWVATTIATAERTAGRVQRGLAAS